jgi:hypothetical protein
MVTDMNMLENIEIFKKMNAVLLKREKFPKKWTPFIAEYFIHYENRNARRK